VLREADVIFDLLVRRDPPDEQEVHEPVIENLFERRARIRPRQARDVDRGRQDAGRREAKGFELVPVTRVAERQLLRLASVAIPDA
jgi:hypothetical protein